MGASAAGSQRREGRGHDGHGVEQELPLAVGGYEVDGDAANVWAAGKLNGSVGRRQPQASW